MERCDDNPCPLSGNQRCISNPSLVRSSLELSYTKVYKPSIRALLGTASHFCEVVASQTPTHSSREVRPDLSLNIGLQGYLTHKQTYPTTTVP